MMAQRVILPARREIPSVVVADALGVSRPALAQHRAKNGFPASFRRGRRFVVNAEELAAWLAGRGITVEWV